MSGHRLLDGLAGTIFVPVLPRIGPACTSGLLTRLLRNELCLALVVLVAQKETFVDVHMISGQLSTATFFMLTRLPVVTIRKMVPFEETFVDVRILTGVR